MCYLPTWIALLPPAQAVKSDTAQASTPQVLERWPGAESLAVLAEDLRLVPALIWRLTIICNYVPEDSMSFLASANTSYTWCTGTHAAKHSHT